MQKRDFVFCQFLFLLGFCQFFNQDQVKAKQYEMQCPIYFVEYGLCNLNGQIANAQGKCDTSSLSVYVYRLRLL